MIARKLSSMSFGKTLKEDINNKPFFRDTGPRITSSSTFPGKLKGGKPGLPRKFLRNDSIVGERTFYQKYLEPIVKIRYISKFSMESILRNFFVRHRLSSCGREEDNIFNYV